MDIILVFCELYFTYPLNLASYEIFGICPAGSFLTTIKTILTWHENHYFHIMESLIIQQDNGQK